MEALTRLGDISVLMLAIAGFAVAGAIVFAAVWRDRGGV